ncbi:response regulator transcription factor [Pseudonocardia pini]|uniref:response regulator transcription factor n=1 Tax=Pseudonocardia pini TaxID=2758030 RepID=UPI0015F09BB9|nr:response regulator transcription factor [Pseudonocardia pini]
MRVVIGEDEPLLREGLTLVLSGNGFEVVSAVGDATALRAAAAAEHPDVVVTDIRMPPDRTDDGLRAALDLRGSLPVVVLSQHVSRRYATALLAGQSGAVGYLLKHRVTDVPGFCEDVRRVARGGVVLDPEVVSVLVDRSARAGAADRLTPRQLQVLGLVAQGRSNLAIAARLGISEKAVARHAAQIYDALELPPSPDDHRRVLAVVRYLDRPTEP